MFTGGIRYKEQGISADSSKSEWFIDDPGCHCDRLTHFGH